MKTGFNFFSKWIVAGVLVFASLMAITFTSRAVVVTNFTQAGLEEAIADGGSATFSTNGTITLTSNLVIRADTIIDGTGFNITLSGGGSNGVRVLFVTNSAALTLLNLKIADGKSTNGPGAGIYVSTNCTLTMSNCILTANLAIGKVASNGKDATSRGAAGGSGTTGFTGMGGGIFNQGTVSLERTLVFGNVASGSNGGDGGNGASAGLFGGAGGKGGSGAPGSGGGIYNGTGGSVSITNCTFQLNIAAGGDGGVGGAGGAASFFGKPGTGGKGGSSLGGAIYNLGLLTISSSTFVTNSVLGGDTAQAAANKNGKAGGAANGGAIYNAGTAFLTNCTLVQNFSQGGKGGDVFLGTFIKGGTGGAAKGGALFNTKVATNVFCTFADNNVIAGEGGVSPSVRNNGSSGAGSGGSVFRSAGKLFIQNTIVAKGSSGVAAAGAIIDGRFNICSDASCKFTKASSSKNSLNPLLGPLGTNGGFAPTISLLTNSPAVDAVFTNEFIGIDERGVTRPQGLRPDIGAFELAPAFSISGTVREGTNGISGITVVAAGAGTTVSQTNGFYLIGGLPTGGYFVSAGPNFTPTNIWVFVGTNSNPSSPGTNATNINFVANGATLRPSVTNSSSNQIFSAQVLAIPRSNYKVQTSTNLTNWTTISTNAASTNGTFSFTSTNNPPVPQRFFRIISP